MISAMFVNMRQPHVILAMRKDSPSAWPIGGRGSVRGGAPVLRYGKSLWGYTVINVCTQIDNSDSKNETGTRARTGLDWRRPGSGCGLGMNT